MRQAAKALASGLRSVASVSGGNSTTDVPDGASGDVSTTAEKGEESEEPILVSLSDEGCRSPTGESAREEHGEKEGDAKRGKANDW